MHGIYRPYTLPRPTSTPLLPPGPEPHNPPGEPGEELLHPKYHLPASCFAYVPNPLQPSTWKLPYRLSDGSIDEKRLPKAIQAILSNYRGAKVSSIPDEDVPAVLLRLARGAESSGKMPDQRGDTAAIYQQLAEVLKQIV